MLYDRVIAQQDIEEPPLFIIGHWRSGTTLLHNLLTQDPNMGFVSTFQTIAPEFSLVAPHILKRLIARFVPEKRYMDNMRISVDYPQEEEIGLANMTPCAHYHWLYFPRNMRYYFERYTLFENVPSEVVEEWKQAYVRLLKKATLAMHGKRLAIKNPANTARIRVLLDIFPDAKFIHIYRNPYHVFASTRHFYAKTLEFTTLQKFSQRQMEETIFFCYTELMKRFFETAEQIVPENFVEICFEELETEPLKLVEHVYEKLHLPGFGAAKSRIEAYVRSQVGYKKNSFTLDRSTIDKVRDRWQFAIEKWQYAVPSDLCAD
jgi:hypothetical protein